MNDGYQGVLIVATVIYFVPAIVAIYRIRRTRVAISVTNLLLGWTLIGWVVAFIWACTANVES